jgi:hypothetical protein
MADNVPEIGLIPRGCIVIYKKIVSALTGYVEFLQNVDSKR